MVKASGSCCAAAGAEKAAAVRAIASAWRNILWVMNLLPTSCLRLPGGADADTEGAGRADQSRRAGDVDIISLVGQVPGIAIERQDRKSVVWGKSVSVRVDLGGRRIIKHKKITNDYTSNINT